mgnify:CR=1 FL=1
MYNIHAIIYIKDNLMIKRNNNDNKIDKLSKNMLTICLASCIIKNGHLKKIQMAHHRLSPVTRNMYEVISEIYRIVKKTLHMVRRKQRSVVQVHERRRFRWRQLKNIFIMMVTQNWEVVSTRDAFKINLESVHM